MSLRKLSFPEDADDDDDWLRETEHHWDIAEGIYLYYKGGIFDAEDK